MGKKTNKNKKGEIKNRLVKYDSLTEQEKQQLVNRLKQDKSNLETRIKEKQNIVDYLVNLTKKEEKKEIHVVISLFSGCLNEVKVFTDIKKAREEYKRQILAAGFSSVEEYEELLRSAIVEKEEPRLWENIEVH